MDGLLLLPPPLTKPPSSLPIIAFIFYVMDKQMRMLVDTFKDRQTFRDWQTVANKRLKLSFKLFWIHHRLLLTFELSTFRPWLEHKKHGPYYDNRYHQPPSERCHVRIFPCNSHRYRRRMYIPWKSYEKSIFMIGRDVTRTNWNSNTQNPGRHGKRVIRTTWLSQTARVHKEEQQHQQQQQ